jgi:hypothetical protein
MYNVDYCVSCHSPDITKTPAYLAHFVAWRSTGNKPTGNIKNFLVKCNHCSFIGSYRRLTEEEEARLYDGYRGEAYNDMRIQCEPSYKDKMYSFNNIEYINARKKGISTLIERNIDCAKIKTVLDYGGDTGVHIPEQFVNAKKYVYDISGVIPMEGILNFNPETDKDCVDFLMCCHVLEHKSDLDILIKELKRHVGENSWIYIEVPNYRVAPPNDLTFHEHINFFSRKSMVALLERHGIIVVDTFREDNLCVLGKLKQHE